MINNKIKIALIILLTLTAFISTIVFLQKDKKEKQIEKEINEKEVEMDNKNQVQPILDVVSVFPVNRAENVPVDIKIEITFNQVDELLDSEFSISPQIPYDLEWKENKLIITPRENFKEGTEYSYIIKYQSRVIPSGPYAFTTKGTLAPLPDTQPEGAFEFEQAFNRTNHPEVFLTNLTPYDTDSFNITSEYTGGENGHYQFTVVQKNPSAKENFLYWLKSIELTEDQVANFDIIYQ